ncbi:GntR family transcriptional regulator [Sphaerisporangium rubeum]|uniref:GntR family transcriptional regulator n=1 Tax=Sphaerisporangium rubeum TaxID=321317 RepID=A0A7X0IAK5_9ACTN|nr:GntR family transcriptional regulator [Sphaerisporangium rubeum]MBB6471671.1 GntR family transcriptional regulator [Sphaerisporangium rubeum]
MAFEYTPPKYAQLIAEMERRIESGEYPPGSPLPSEHQLMSEFGMARPTVVKALGVLRDNGWIITQQGKGRFVRGRPALAAGQHPRTGRELLERREIPSVTRLVSVGLVKAPRRIAAYLGQDAGASVLLRKTVVDQDGQPSEIVAVWLPPQVAEGTALAASKELSQGVRRQVESVAGVGLDHIVEHLTARNPDKEERELLGVGASAALLDLYAVACDATGKAWVVLQTVLPGDRHELEDAYPIR